MESPLEAALGQLQLSERRMGIALARVAGTKPSQGVAACKHEGRCDSWRATIIFRVASDIAATSSLLGASNFRQSLRCELDDKIFFLQRARFLQIALTRCRRFC